MGPCASFWTAAVSASWAGSQKSVWKRGLKRRISGMFARNKEGREQSRPTKLDKAFLSQVFKVYQKYCSFQEKCGLKKVLLFIRKAFNAPGGIRTRIISLRREKHYPIYATGALN